MRFDNYINRIDEKVSQKEIDEALMDPNITIGVEFEFIVNELKEYVNTDLVNLYDVAYSEWEDFLLDRDEYNNSFNDLTKDFSKLEDEINELEDKISDLESEDGYDEDEVGKLIDELDEKKLKRDEVDSDLDDLEKPWPGSDYIDYLEQLYSDYGHGSNPNHMAYDDFEAPPHPQDTGSYDLQNESNWINAVTDLKWLFDSLPIPNDYVIKGYSYHEYDKWAIKYDSSIADEGGVELVSPPINIFDFMKITPKIFDWIAKNGDTSSSCGLHIHMGVKGVSNLKQVMDPIKLVLMTDEDYIWKFFDDRKYNTYTNSMKEPMFTRGVSGKDFKDLINWENLKNHIGDDHYSSINFESWEKGHIEFRHMGGEGYHKKFKDIMSIVARNAHSLAVSVDPDYKRKEYIKKLNRMANKVEKFILVTYREFIYWYISTYDLSIKMEAQFINEIKKLDKKLAYYSDVNVKDYISSVGEFSSIYFDTLQQFINGYVKDVYDKYSEENDYFPDAKIVRGMFYKFLMSKIRG